MKLLIQIAGVVVFYFIVFVNSGRTFTKVFGGSGEDIGYRARQAVDGGFISTGSTDSYGAGLIDAFIAKHDYDGNIEWIKTYGTTGNSENGFDIRVLSNDNGYVMVGNENTANVDILVVKLFLNGSEEWIKTISVGSGSDYGRMIRETTDGGYILMGGSDSFGAGVDWIVIKLNKTGNIEWTRGLGSGGTDNGFSIDLTSDGGYICSGYYRNGGSYDWMLVKLNSGGGVIWSKELGGTGDDYSEGTVRELSDGSFVVSGAFQGAAGFGNRDFWIAKFDSSGNVLWDRLVGDTAHEELRDLTITTDGNVVVAGGTSSFSSSSDCAVIKLDSSTGTIITGGEYSPTRRKIPQLGKWKDKKWVIFPN